MTYIIPVLLYHSVAEEPARDPRFAVSPAAFQTHVEAIKASGRMTLLISDLATALRGQCPSPLHAAAVTFDDGFADTYEAVSSLLDHGIRSTLYVTTSEIGAADRLERSQVSELAGMSEIEIGAHAVHHRYLDELEDRELTDEVELSKSQLEYMTQGPVGSFAYPHGAYDRRVRQAVIDGGYSSAAGVKNAVSHLADDPFAIARWTVTAGTSARRISQILQGERVPRAWSGERVRTRAYRAFRRGRRGLAVPRVHS